MALNAFGRKFLGEKFQIMLQCKRWRDNKEYNGLSFFYGLLELKSEFNGGLRVLTLL